MSTLSVGSKSKKKTEQLKEKTELEISEEKRKCKYLFCSKIEKAAGKFSLFLLAFYIVLGLVSSLLEHFGLVDLESKLAKDVCFVMVWLLGVSVLTWFVFAVLRSEFDGSADHDVYPNLM
jgi:hypothetical protein